MTDIKSPNLPRAIVPSAVGDTLKFRYIDVARGTAILLVVLVHTSQSVPRLSHIWWLAASLGQMGVQLFFVASALTLCFSASERGFATQAQVRNFYLRRFFRIAPLYYTGIIFYNVLLLRQINVLPGITYSSIAKGVAANLLLIHGLVPSANNNVVPGGWSIGTEVLFYALFPFLFWAVIGVRRATLFFALSLGIAFFWQLLLCTITTRPIHIQNNSFSYLLIINQLPVFACGFILASAPATRSSIWNLTWNLLIAIMFLLTMAWFFHYSKFGLAFVLVPALAGLGFLFFVRAISMMRLDNLFARIIAELGKKSFSIYIIHFIFAWKVARFCVLHLISLRVPPDANLVLLVTGTVIGSYLCACVTGRLIEAPGILLGKSIIARLHRPTLSVS